MITEAMQIPRATLQPGSYSLSIEDRLKDRAVVRVSSLNSKQHFLVLAVKSRKLVSDNSKGIILFNPADEKLQILRGWVCPSCEQELEFVYPKLDALKITAETGQAVLAVDPSFDKLPNTLSSDDMKVVTLWLLAPERIMPDRRGSGLRVARYEDAPVMRADAKTVARVRHGQLPKTASNTFSLAAWGVGLLLAGCALRLRRAHA
ncbi:MAG: LPXTG cell wall anchor domain-containing protein [Bryobacteraceae bacterium]